MPDSYQLDVVATDTIASHPFHLFTLDAHPVTLSGLPDTIASEIVAGGKEFTGEAEVVAGPALKITIADNIPDLPASLIDNIDLSKLPFAEEALAKFASALGLTFNVSGTITKSAA